MELAEEGVGMTINITGVMRDWMTESKRKSGPGVT